MPPKRRIPVLWALSACLASMVVLTSSCNDKIKTDLVAFKALDEGLTNSNLLIGNASEITLYSLEDLTNNPRTAAKAEIWYPKAKLIYTLSSNIYLYIEELRSALKVEAGKKIIDGVESYREADKSAVTHVFTRKEKGKELFGRLKEYRQEVLAIDPMIAQQFTDKLVITTRAFDSTVASGDDFRKNFFDETPTVAALAVLNSFKNNVKLIENKLIDFCNSQLSRSVVGYVNRYTVVAAINSSFVKIGDPMEIIAGMGHFSTENQPIITIKGTTIPIDIDGIGHYKFKADKPGKHKIAVEISYLSMDGLKHQITKEIEYTVSDKN